MNERIVGRGRIVDGAGVFQDFCFRRWPQCRTIAKDPAMVFDVEWDGRLWECKADGYGYQRSRGEDGEYGNGSIFVKKFDGVELVDCVEAAK